MYWPVVDGQCGSATLGQRSPGLRLYSGKLRVIGLDRFQEFVNGRRSTGKILRISAYFVFYPT